MAKSALVEGAKTAVLAGSVILNVMLVNSVIGYHQREQQLLRRMEKAPKVFEQPSRPKFCSEPASKDSSFRTVVASMLRHSKSCAELPQEKLYRGF